MALLRLVGIVLLYSAIGLVIYYLSVRDERALVLAVIFGVIGGILLWVTPNPNLGRQRQAHHSSRWWDWWDIIEFVEIPYGFIRWLFRIFFKIFD